MKKSLKKGIKASIGIILSVLIGMVIGILAVNKIDPNGDLPFGTFTLRFLLFFAGLLLILYAEIILHEAGHLIFGLLSGYRFSSFRVGSLMLLRTPDGMKLKRLSLAGTGGQCLMIPPEDRTPYRLYNLGGSIMNALTGLILLPIWLGTGSLFCASGTIIGFAFALINGVPLRLGTIDNDGYNALSLGRNADALRSFRVQTLTVGQAAAGKRLSEMPAEWFTPPAEENLDNTMAIVLAVFAENRLMDEGKLAEAEKAALDLLPRQALNGLHRELLQCDLDCCRLLLGETADKPLLLSDPKRQSFRRAMANFPAVLRTEYIGALLSERDRAAADGIRARFEQTAKSYPYPSDLLSERELMDAADRIYSET